MSSNSTDIADVKKVRRFGLIAFLFFGCLCALGFWRHRPIPLFLFGFLSILGLGFILIPASLRPVYTLWNRIAFFLARIFTALILILAYYLVITPFGLIKRLFGGRPLPIRPDKNASSYWISRTGSVQPIERFLKRY